MRGSGEYITARRGSEENAAMRGSGEYITARRGSEENATPLGRFGVSGELGVSGESGVGAALAGSRRSFAVAESSSIAGCPSLRLVLPWISSSWDMAFPFAASCLAASDSSVFSVWDFWLGRGGVWEELGAGVIWDAASLFAALPTGFHCAASLLTSIARWRAGGTRSRWSLRRILLLSAPSSDSPFCDCQSRAAAAAARAVVTSFDIALLSSPWRIL
jgi:hypothetical protein